MEIKPDETLSPFIRGKISIIQKKEGYRFNIDSVLLSSFPEITKRKGKIIDLGTGSGIILILLSLKYPDLQLYGIEIQQDLYDIAKRNAKLNNININLIKGDVKDIKNFFKPQSFDYVITNPPYFKSSFTKKDKEEIQIARYEITGKIEDFIKAGSFLLKDKGRFYMIYPSDRLSEIIQTLKKYKIQPKRYRFIHPSLQEKSTHFLIEAVKSGKEGGETVEKPLIIYDNPNIQKYSEEVKFLLEKFI
ncbi:tRNA1(Val) (adenine(37)-N6)-methyltransferase [Persephonella sp.]